jgi:hypothetical protein
LPVTIWKILDEEDNFFELVYPTPNLLDDDGDNDADNSLRRKEDNTTSSYCSSLRVNRICKSISVWKRKDGLIIKKICCSEDNKYLVILSKLGM